MNLKMLFTIVAPLTMVIGCLHDVPTKNEKRQAGATNNSDPHKTNFVELKKESTKKKKRERVQAKIDSIYALLEQTELKKRSTTYTVGYFQDEYWANCSGPGLTEIFMDDENDYNESRLEKESPTGRIPASSSGTTSEEFLPSNYEHPIWGYDLFTGIGQPDYGIDTKFRICKQSVSSLPKVTFDYAVVLLSGYCPPETEPFSRYWDNEDENNSNYYTGTFGLPNFQDSDGTHIAFCFVPKDTTLIYDVYQSISIATGHGGVLARPTFSYDAVQYHQGWLRTDDEDDHNSNWWGTDYTSYSARINHFFGNSPPGANTQMYFIWQRPIPLGVYKFN